MLSAVLFPLTLGLCYAFTICLWVCDGVDDTFVPRIIAGTISGLAAMMFGRQLFRSLKRGMAATPIQHFFVRRVLFAVVLSLASFVPAYFTIRFAIENVEKAKPGGFDAYVLNEQKRMLEDLELKWRLWESSASEARSTYAPSSETELTKRRHDLLQIQRKVDGARFRLFVGITTSLLFVLLGLWTSVLVIRGGGATLRMALGIPLATVLILSIAMALFLQAERHRIAIEKQNRPQIQSTR